MEPKRVMTKYHPSLLDSVKSTRDYVYLRDNIKWEEGVRSKRGFTRLARALNRGENKVVDDIISETLEKLGVKNKYDIYGIYLNYYKDGTHYTPSHSHKGTSQLIISLGATRILQVSSKEYSMGNGDVIIFGSSVHGIKQEPELINTKESGDIYGRISIATFMRPHNSNIPQPIPLNTPNYVMVYGSDGFILTECELSEEILKYLEGL